MRRLVLGGVVCAITSASCAYQRNAGTAWTGELANRSDDVTPIESEPRTPQDHPAPGADGAVSEAPDLWSRPQLTGDWGGARTALADAGINVRADLTTIYQNVFEGGFASTSEIGANYDLWLDFDTGKMGLWPGGFLNVYAEAQTRDSVNAEAGSFLAVNGDALFPEPDKDVGTVTSLTYTQFLSHNFGLFFGKVEVLNGDKNTYAHGRSKTNFINFGFVYNPVAIWTVPYTGLGGGFILVNGDDFVLTVTALDSEGEPGKAGWETWDNGGTTFSAEARVAVSPLDLSGHQLFGAIWSTRTLLSLDQDPFPPLDFDDRSWSVYYNFDQNVYEAGDGSGQAIGVFGRVGVSDGNPNPVEWFGSFGVGGQGLFRGREKDTFGLGYYFLSADERAQPFFGISDTSAYELFYNFEVTPWLHITPDLQLIDSALPGLDNTWVAGIRGHLQF